MPSDKRRAHSRSPAYREKESRRPRYEEDRDELRKLKDDRKRSRSPEKGRERNKEKERERDRNRERDRDRVTDRDKDRGRETDRNKDRVIGRGSEREKEKEKERDWERRRRRGESDKEDDDSTLRWKRRGRERYEDNHRERERERDRNRDRYRDIERSSDRNRRQTRGEETDSNQEEPTSRQKRNLPSSDKGRPSPSPSIPKDKDKPNFSNTGLLAAATNTLNNVVLKYTEPLDSRLPPPSHKWLLYTFKDSKVLSTTELHTQTCWLFGRDRSVTDFPLDHPSVSKQHAVIQFRHITKTNEYGDKKSLVKPYVVDLGSANKTSLNGEEIPETRFVELKSGDLLKFGLSTREYVIMFDEEK